MRSYEIRIGEEYEVRISGRWRHVRIVREVPLPIGHHRCWGGPPSDFDVMVVATGKLITVGIRRIRPIAGSEGKNLSTISRPLQGAAKRRETC